MIHQLIFAHPKPGMSEPDFQKYWKEVHAVNYASKIPQIRKYMIDCRIPFGPEPADPLFSGVAEIWLENETEQLASLQTKEFLDGARLDEPKWAAFWRTVVADTDAHVLLEGPAPVRNPTWIKLQVMIKRKAGIPREVFQGYALQVHGPKVLQLPGLRRYLQCHVRDGAYGFGEPLLDSVSQLWFDNVDALQKALDSPQFREGVQPDIALFAEPNYVHTLVTDETWIIGPGCRAQQS